MNFDTNKQKLLLEYLISSPDTFTRCIGILKSDYFDRELKGALKFVLKYYDQFSSLPDVKIIKAESGVTLIKHDDVADQLGYCLSEIESFCKFSGMKNAVIKSAELINNGEYAQVAELVKDALLISLNKDLGLRYFEDPEDRLRKMLEESPVMSTGWESVDEALFGGIGRKELVLFSASSGGGKSITLANLGLNFLEMKRNVLYISFELSPEIIAQRYDTMITGISRKTWKDNVGDIIDGLRVARSDHGILDIVQMPSGTKANQIEAYLKEFHLYHNIVPDLLILDYIDLMEPNSGASDGVWDKDKQVSEQARNLGVEWDFPVASATQLNRSAVGQEKHSHAMIAGGISKINTCDTWITILLDDIRKQKGEVNLQFGKTRNSDAVGSNLTLKWDPKYLRILDAVKKPGLQFVPKNPSKKKSPLDLMNL